MKYNLDYTDHASRNGSQSTLSKLGETALLVFISLFIASLVGSTIWGAEGFVEVLAGLIN